MLKKYKTEKTKKLVMFALIALLSSLLNIAITTLVSVFFSESEFSKFFIYMGYATVVINIFMLGAGNIIAAYKDDIIEVEKKYIFFWVACLFPLIGLFLLLLISGISYFHLMSVSWFDLLGILVFVLGMSSLQLIKSSFLINYKFKEIIYVLFISLLFSFLTLLLIYFTHFNLNKYFLITGILYQLLSFIVAWQRNFLEILKKVKLKKHVKFGIPSALNSALMGFLVTGDRIIIPILKFSDQRQIADYLFASLIAGYSLFIVNIFASYWAAYITNFWVNATNDQKHDLYKKQNKLFFWIFLPIIFIPLILIYKFFVQIDDLFGYYLICLILLISHMFSGINKFYLGFILMFKNSKFNMISTIYASLVFVLSTIFLKMIIGVYGIAIGALLGSITLTLRSYLYVNKNILKIL